MANRPDNLIKSSWQRSRWTQALVMLLVIVPIYGMAIVSHTNRERPYNLNEVILSTGVFASLALIGLLFILRFLCGERFSALNLKQGSWWQDVLGGFALTVVTLGTHLLLGPVIDRVLSRTPDSGMRDFFNGLAEDPWLLVLFLGPILAVGVAGFEEITRIFLLSRWWKIASGSVWRWLGVLVSAVLVGLTHFYQGPAGVANTAVSSLIVGFVYLRFGRIWPLIISHYLHDALQIILVVVMIRNGEM